MKSAYYLKKLIKNGYCWQYTDVLGNKKKPTLFFLPAQMLILLVSGFSVVFLLNNGFDKDFTGYTNAALAIITGLYLTIVISLFEKHNKDDFSCNGLTEKQKDNLRLKKNFLIQFTSLASYSIILALTCLILLSVTLQFDYLNQCICIKRILSLYNGEDYCGLTEVFAIIVYRWAILYFLLDIVYISTYIISSAYSYIVGEYDKNKIE